MIYAVALHIFSAIRVAVLPKGIIGNRRININEEGLREITEHNDLFFGWNGINSIVSDSNYIYFYIQRSLVILVPKKYFPSKNDAEVFLNQAVLWKSKTLK